MVIAWSMFENSRIALRIRENCQDQLAMSAVGMCDLVHIVASQFLVELKAKRTKYGILDVNISCTGEGRRKFGKL